MAGEVAVEESSKLNSARVVEDEDEFLLAEFDDLRRNDLRLIARSELSRKKDERKLEDNDLDCLGLDRGRDLLLPALTFPAEVPSEALTVVVLDCSDAFCCV